MKKNAERRKQRLRLGLFYSAVIFVALVLASVLVGLMAILLIKIDTLDMGIATVNVGKYVLNLLLFSVLFGTILSVLAVRFPLKPIRRILSALQSLSAGDYSVRLPLTGIIARSRTLRELTESFNAMASELERTELLRLDFVNNFSHEFKTPIVSISGFAKLLRRGNLPEEKQQEYLQIIEEESLRLAQMATNVMNLTKVENQTILTGVTRFNLTEQLRTCALLLESRWERKHLELRLPEEEFYAVGSEELLSQVWINLLDNAIKFSPEYETVYLEIIPDHEAVSVTVTNTGDPIPEESMALIFRKFYQVDTSHASEGNGVGLAIVKKIVQLHGGTVQVSCHGGKTIFSVSLPQKN